MSKIDDKATVSLFVNGEQAEQAMDRLRKKSDELQSALKSALDAGNKKEANKLQRQLDSVNKELNRTESAAKGTGMVLNDLTNSSIHGLRNALKFLEKELRYAKPNSEQWHQYADSIKLVKARLSELNEQLEGTESLWSRFKGWATGAWPALDLLGQWGSNVFDVMRSSVDAFATMDQEMANVRKFTGMTADQVEGLNEAFKGMDTRTSREDLNKLAQEAGRLGKTSKEDILGFVRAADQINVALDDLGEGATLTLSKLTGIFGDEQRYGTEKALLKVGSVINELSQNCSASAPYLAQFASRMGGVGAQAKMTIPQIMAFGAVLDSNGQAVEASSTALSQVIVRMMQEPAKYAKVAGLDVQKFTDMLKTDVNGALIMFLETLQEAGGLDTLSPMFKDMGENGARAINALSTLATHIDDVKKQQQEANKAFADGTSIGNEFSVQNNTVQASIDKAKKAANEMRVELGQRLYPLMSHMLSSSAALMRALSTTVNFIFENKAAIISLTIALAAYNIAANLAAIKTTYLAAAEKAQTIAAAAMKTGILGLSSVMYLLSGNVTKATASFKLFSLAIKASPIGLVVSGIAMAVSALGTWALKVRAARKAEEELAAERAKNTVEFIRQISDLSAASKDYAAQERSRLKKLYDATQDTTKSLKERIAAVQELQRTYPTAFGNLTTEKILAGEAASAYNTLAENIIKAAKAKAAAEKIQENESKLIELELEQADLSRNVDKYKRARDMKKEKLDGLLETTRGKATLGGVSSEQQKEIKKTTKEVGILNDVYEKTSDRLTVIAKQTYVIEATNKRLAAIASGTTVNDPDIKFQDNTIQLPGAPVDGSDDGSGKGYVSQAEQKKSEKERKKQEAEARRAAAKAKQEFKSQMDAYKAQRISADREVLELYKAGSIDYEELLRRRHENENGYYDTSLAYFEKVFEEQKDSYLQDDKDYQKLLLDKEKADEKYEQSRVSLAIESINRRKEAEERDRQHIYDVKSDPSLQDEIALQSDLYQIRMKALIDTQALYTEGSKEYADIKYKIESLEMEKEMNLKKLYFKSVNTLRKEYDKKSSAEKFQLEKATLDALLKENIISAEKYAAYLKALAEKYKQELPGASEKSWSDSDQKKYDGEKKALEEALASQIITQEEFNDRLANLDDARRKKMLAGLKEAGGEWNSMAADIYTSFTKLLDGFDGSLAGTIENIASCTAAVSAMVGSAMQIATQFAKAESEIQIAAVEKRYDREVKLAQGNSYKVAQAEKKKEKEIQKIKSEAAQKEFALQVFMAIAQTAQNAIMAYTAGLSFPFPANTVMPAVLAALAVAQGTLQVALLKKQQQAAASQGYSKGGFTKPGRVDEPAGIVHAGEWVASQKLLANPVARPMIEALDHAQRTNTIGSLQAEDVSRSIRANDSLARMAEGDASTALMVAAIAQNAQVIGSLNERLNEPFVTINSVTGPHGIKQAEDEYARLINNKSSKSRRNATDRRW